MAKKASKKFTDTAIKISNFGDFILGDDRLDDWEVDKIEFTSKTNPNEKIVCAWEKENGTWVKKCRKV